MKILYAHERQTMPGPPEWFTGQVTVDPILPPSPPAVVQAALVTFRRGARTHWHTHPLGQTLYIVSGIGYAQSQGQPKQVLTPGDVIVFEPGEVHWHGAGDEGEMAHLAMQGSPDGGPPVTWGEPVVDA